MTSYRVPSLLLSSLLALAGTASPPVAAATQPESWGEVTNLSRPAAATYSPMLTVSRHGRVLAAWVRGDGRHGRILVATRHRDGAWTSPRRVPGTRGATEVAAGYDGSGDLVVAWTAGRRVRAVRGTTAGSWEAPATLHRTRSGPRGTRPAYLDLAVNGRGRAVLAWQTMDDDLDATYARPRVQAVVGAPSGWWSRTRTLSAHRHSAFQPQGVVSEAGRATVAWTESRGRSVRVMTASREVRRAWEPPRALTPWKREYGAPRLAVNAAGEVVVAWAAGRSIGLRWWSPAEGWTRVDRVPGVRARVSWLDVGIDGAGATTVGWTNGAHAVWTAVRTHQGSWSRARVAPRGSVFYGIRVLVNQAGAAVVGWDGQGGREHDVEAAYRARGASTWGPATALSDVRGDAGGLTLALDERGSVTAAWLFAPRFGADSRVQARHLSAR